MRHIVIIGYLFVAVMFSAAQPGIARALIYLLFWAVLPMIFLLWVVAARSRNRLMKRADRAESEALRQKKQTAEQAQNSDSE
ncbi:hypothetical protein [Neisseria yangbaofengii]|uniref:hypothetical protein n=1 Tax=Neisseria yangbaofengii TaxID=2709396 RepID=UPI0013EB0E42|nr:hypothetical protein [Neisseria yangbaofengii]